MSRYAKIYKDGSAVYSRGKTRNGSRRRVSRGIYSGQTVSIFLLLIIFSAIFYLGQTIVRADTAPKQFYVDSRIVRSGDTLWDIAKLYKSDYYKTTAEYVEAIKKCNGITEDTIKAGTYLIIPYTD